MAHSNGVHLKLLLACSLFRATFSTALFMWVQSVGWRWSPFSYHCPLMFYLSQLIYPTEMYELVLAAALVTWLSSHSKQSLSFLLILNIFSEFIFPVCTWTVSFFVNKVFSISCMIFHIVNRAHKIRCVIRNGHSRCIMLDGWLPAWLEFSVNTANDILIKQMIDLAHWGLLFF